MASLSFRAFLKRQRSSLTRSKTSRNASATVLIIMFSLNAHIPFGDYQSFGRTALYRPSRFWLWPSRRASTTSMWQKQSPCGMRHLPANSSPSRIYARRRRKLRRRCKKIQPRRPSALSMAESMPFGERSPAHISSAWRRTYSLHQVATFLLRREPGGRAALQSAYSASSAAIMRPMRSLICPIWFFVTPKRSATLSMGSSSSTYAR